MSLKPLSSLKATGGRSSVAGATVTVFGATGFLGRYVCSRLGAMGARMLIPYRGDEIYTRHLRPMADLGGINFYDMSIRKVEEIERAVAGSSVVINLLGKHLETSRWSFQDAHASFPAVLGTIAAEQGVERVIHMSALGASAASPSAWARSKAVGEENIREAFPGTTILRCAPIFGDEDRLLNRIAKMSRAMPVLPLVDGDAKQQPVFADDVARAVVQAMVDPACAGQTYSLCGPKAYSNKELAEYVFKVRAQPGPRDLRRRPRGSPRHCSPCSDAPCSSGVARADDRRRQQRGRPASERGHGDGLRCAEPAGRVADVRPAQNAERRDDDARGRARPGGARHLGPGAHRGHRGALPDALQEAVALPGPGGEENHPGAAMR